MQMFRRRHGDHATGCAGEPAAPIATQQRPLGSIYERKRSMPLLLRAKLLGLGGALALLGGLAAAAPSAHAGPLPAPSAQSWPIRWVGGNATVSISQAGCHYVIVWGQNFPMGDTVVVTLYQGGLYPWGPNWAFYKQAYPTAIDTGTLHGYFATAFDVSTLTHAGGGAFYATAQDGLTATSAVISC